MRTRREVEARRSVFYKSSKFGFVDVMNSATTAALCEFEAPPFTVVESKGAFGLFRVYRSVFNDVISRAAAV